jgi:hypothetical protein
VVLGVYSILHASQEIEEPVNLTLFMMPIDSKGRDIPVTGHVDA